MMDKALPESRPIAELAALEPESLYLFVLGPGEGEALAVALPESCGWLLIDGCRSGDRGIGLIDVLERWRRGDEPILLYALTHPHADHAKGIVELVEEYGHAIRAVAVTPPWNAMAAPAAITSRQVVARQVVRGLQALDRLCTRGALRIDLTEGATLPTPKDVRVRVLSPNAARATATGADPNELSAVIEVVLGSARLVLGSDLPAKAAAGGGWDALCRRSPEIADHSVLKIPHHGSSTSHHAPLFARHQATRAWACTPFNSHALPDVVRMTGLSWILRRGRPVHLTSPPVSKTLQVPVPHPGSIRLSQLSERIREKPIGVPLLDRGAVDATPVAIRSSDSLWCFRIHREQGVASRWRGDAALEVSP